ncbi:MAG: tetratricopeptide repeat protein [Alphaproteobacteria bacterium]
MSPLIVLLIVATGPAAADQRDVRVDELFDRLGIAGDAREAALIEVTIWEIWRVYTGDDYDVTEFFNRGLRAIRRTEYRSAEILFGGVISRAPEFAEGWNGRAAVRYTLGDFAGSIADSEMALELEPRHFAALSRLGDCFIALDRPARALAAFEAALAINPRLPSAQGSAARLRERRGDAI